MLSFTTYWDYPCISHFIGAPTHIIKVLDASSFYRSASCHQQILINRVSPANGQHNPMLKFPFLRSLLEPGILARISPESRAWHQDLTQGIYFGGKDPREQEWRLGRMKQGNKAIPLVTEFVLMMSNWGQVPQGNTVSFLWLLWQIITNWLA